MAYFSRVSYSNLSGGQTVFPVPFPYIAKNHVGVYVAAAGADPMSATALTPSTDYTWTSAGVITTTAPHDGKDLHIRRNTPSAVPSITGGTLVAGVQKRIDLQLLYLGQEAADQAADLADTSVRSLRAPWGETIPALPPASQRKGGLYVGADPLTGALGLFRGTAGVQDAQMVLVQDRLSGTKFSTVQGFADFMQSSSASGFVKTSSGRTVQAVVDQVAGAVSVTPPSKTASSAIALGAGQRASGAGCSVVSAAGGGIVTLTGAGSSLQDLALVGAGTVSSSTSVVGVRVNNASSSSVRGVSVDLTGSPGKDLPAFNLTGNLAGHLTMAVKGNTPGYCYIVNEDVLDLTSQKDGHTLIGFDLTSGTADAIEFNCPGAPLKNSVTWGGILDAGRSGSGAGAGFALGFAHVQGFVVGGVVSKYARTAGMHIEDGCSFGVISALALRGNQQDGIWASVGGYGAHQAEATPLVLTGFSLEGPGKAVSGTQGVYTVWDAKGYTDRWQLVGGYLKGFDVGLHLDGLGVIHATSITCDSVNKVLQTAGAAHFGVVLSTESTTLFEVSQSSGGRAGKFVQFDVCPSTFISRTSTSPLPPGAFLEGYAGPALMMNSGPVDLPALSLFAADLFPAPKRMRGRLRIMCRLQVGGGLFWEGDVLCDDGLAVTVLGTPLYEANSAVAVSAFAVLNPFTGNLYAVNVTPDVSNPNVDPKILTVTAASAKVLRPRMTLQGTGVQPGTRILEQIKSTEADGSLGGKGWYLLNIGQDSSYSRTDLRAYSPLQINAGKLQLALYNGGGTTIRVSSMTVEFDGTYYL